MISNGNCWLDKRTSGVLAHVSALPGDYGIGNLGTSAREFIDYLGDCGFEYWQICPLGPTGFGDSPYQSFSSFAGNAYLLDLDELAATGLLQPQELEPLRALPRETVDFGSLYTTFWPILHRAWERFRAAGKDVYGGASFSAFCRAQAGWLDAYAAFMALKASHGGLPWTEWEPQYRDFGIGGTLELTPDVAALAHAHRFYQFLFFHQWEKLRAHARARGVGIIGDLPIFVSMDSADTWQFRKVFRLDPQGHPLAVAGVPPDYFSATGQFWGNPLYDWDYLKSTGYDWWARRLAFAFECCDVLRLDHFRAFDTYWEIPAGSADARTGTMRDGPGLDFFRALAGRLPAMRIIAEDLGYITEGTVLLRKTAGFPGMKILQFGYGHDDNNVNLPHFFHPESVVYTGTHDNDTTRGWLASLNGDEAGKVRRYFKLRPGDNSAWPMIKAGFACVSRLAVIPVQDLLDLGSEARFNRPGISGGNWSWRFTHPQLELLRKRTVGELQQLHRLYDRGGKARQREYSAPPSGTSLSRH